MNLPFTSASNASVAVYVDGTLAGLRAQQGERLALMRAEQTWPTR